MYCLNYQFVLNVRVTVAWNPVNPKMRNLAEVPSKIFQNTLEQYVFHLVAILILATHLREEQMKIVPILDVTWALGRVLFAEG